jgi:predicted nucleic acid-binding protein
MEGKQIFDSNVWIGYFTTHDPHHKKASALFEKLDSTDTIYITSEIITEVTTVICMRYGLAEAQIFVDFLLHTERVVRIPSGLYFDTALNHFLKLEKTKLSFTDLTLALLSEQFQIHTFDKALAKEVEMGWK